LPLEVKPACSVGHAFLQHLDSLEQETECNGGVVHALADHFARVHVVEMTAT
jgi:hypothetical protein